jgi:hypothetical protein
MRWLATLLCRSSARLRETRRRTRHAVRHPSAGLAVAATAAVFAPPSLGDGAAASAIIALHPTGVMPSARGTAQLAPAPSPFGAAVTRDGHLIYDVTVRAEGLGAAGAGRVFVAWAAAPNLEDVRRIGPLGADGSARGSVDLNKFMIIVTAEPSTTGQRWTGTALLKGVSPSSLLQSFVGHGLFEVPGE